MALKLNMWQISGFVMASVMNIMNMDANRDGKIDGKEKMKTVQNQANLVLQSFPELAAKLKADPAKFERYLQKQYDALDELIT